nr:hypothetical protein [uncultured Rhodopila sp.]
MFSLAYVLLPVSDIPSAEAIRASLAPFQRGGRGDLPQTWLAFDDETDALRQAHAADFTFVALETGGMRIEGGADTFHLDMRKVQDEMKRLGLKHWRVRFADDMDLDLFFDRFARRLERHPDTGRFGRWLNPLGEWDWWDLGGRFDGWIACDQQTREGRRVAGVSSGPDPGRILLANIENVLSGALGQEPPPLLEVQNDSNIEMVATLLGDAREGRENAYPPALVLPSGAVEDGLRWLKTWPGMGPRETFAWLGEAPEAAREEIVRAAYARFEDRWAAGVAFHHWKTRFRRVDRA